MESANDNHASLMNVLRPWKTVTRGLIFLGMSPRASIINLSARLFRKSLLDAGSTRKAQQTGSLPMH